ncbi:hypothetical protein MAR621_03050 [Maribacter dokdonensis]|uniref:hypothetical protein n=1 Tax=Maribacter dokdonensis TaxID=320912 RepID=UPI001B1A5B73|nr:hypothetical protein [Maribacter dokdonensis]CAG2532856.1 hypothetical protein MAR621_03050 [Maribacter dokdonensis]
MMGTNFDKVLDELKISSKPKTEYSSIKMEEEIIINILDKYDIKIDSIYDLIQNRNDYKDIIPILLNILRTDILTNEKVIEGVVRALTIKGAKGLVEEILIKNYNALSKEDKRKSLGWTYGNAIEYLYSDRYVDINEILRIVKNKNNGTSRQMFVLALGKTKKHIEKVAEVLIELTYDSEVDLHALTALYKLKYIKAAPRIKELSKSSKIAVRKKSQQFLKKYGVEK